MSIILETEQLDILLKDVKSTAYSFADSLEQELDEDILSMLEGFEDKVSNLCILIEKLDKEKAKFYSQELTNLFEVLNECNKKLITKQNDTKTHLTSLYVRNKANHAYKKTK